MSQEYKVITDPNNPLFGKSYDEIKRAVQQDGYVLGYVEEQPDELCKLAVQQCGLAIQYVNKQTEEICKLAVQRNGYALEFIENQTEELCKLAVQQNGLALMFVKDQTDEVCKLAVQQDGWALKFVKNQTEELCKLAVQQYGLALVYVINQTEEICKLAIQQCGHALRWVENQTEEICRIALNIDLSNLIYIRNQKVFGYKTCADRAVPGNDRYLFRGYTSSAPMNQTSMPMFGPYPVWWNYNTQSPFNALSHSFGTPRGPIQPNPFIDQGTDSKYAKTDNNNEITKVLEELISLTAAQGKIILELNKSVQLLLSMHSNK